jgi:hypothetical protein
MNEDYQDLYNMSAVINTLLEARDRALDAYSNTADERYMIAVKNEPMAVAKKDNLFMFDLHRDAVPVAESKRNAERIMRVFARATDQPLEVLPERDYYARVIRSLDNTLRELDPR